MTGAVDAFPFLIGTVRTRYHTFEEGTPGYLVSIPHRYGKNVVEETKAQEAKTLFPFLIGTVRTC